MDTDLLDCVQRAIEAADFDRVPVLINEYGAHVREQLRSTGDCAERERIAGEALEELRGLLILARVIRSHLSRHLQTAQAPLRYAQSHAGVYTWRMEG